MKISVSLLSGYLYCSRKVFLQQVLMIEEPDKESVVLGTIRHETYDGINKNEQDIVSSINEKINMNDLEKLYQQKYLEILRKSIVKNKKRLDSLNLSMMSAYRYSFPFIIEESKMRASNIFNFIEQNNVFGEELWEKLTPKILSEVRIESDELKLKGIIDQVHIYDNEYVPFELKTGKMPQDGVWPSHRVQIAAYSLLLQEKFQKNVKEGFVHYLDANEKRQIVMNPFMRDEIKALVDEVIALLEKRDIPDFCENKNKCRNCGVKETCYNEEEVGKLIKLVLKNN